MQTWAIPQQPGQTTALAGLSPAWRQESKAGQRCKGMAELGVSGERSQWGCSKGLTPGRAPPLLLTPANASWGGREVKGARKGGGECWGSR